MELAIAMPDINWTVIIINDGSPAVPSVNELFQHLSARINYYYYHYKINRGKGYAVRLGFNKAANADVFIYTDYDFPFGIKAVVNAVNILRRKEADIVAADRGSQYLSFLPFPRRIITRLNRIINAKVLKLHFTDTQAGLKGMNNRSLPLMLHTSINGFLFDLQFIRNAVQQRLRIHGLPVTCTKDIQLKNFRISIIYTEIKNLLILLFKQSKKQNILSSYSGSAEIRYSIEVWTNTFRSKGDQFARDGFHSVI
ncbi:MAG: hypothetical protein NVS3B8_13860 [Chitinophagaceae bacterium]